MTAQALKMAVFALVINPRSRRLVFKLTHYPQIVFNRNRAAHVTFGTNPAEVQR